MIKNLLTKYRRKILIFISFISVININYSNPLTAEEYFNKGLENHLDNNLKSAEENYLESYKLKEDKDTAYNLAILYDNQNQYTLSEMYYKEAIKHGKNEAYYNLGHLYSKQEKKTLAIQNYIESINKTGNVDAMYNLGVIYKDLGDYQKALEYFQMAYNNGDREAFYWVANMNERLGNFDIAERNYKNLADSSNNRYAAYNLARIYENKQDKRNAIKYYEQSKNVIDESYYRLGLLYEDINNLNKSEENYKIYISKTNDEKAIINLGEMYERNNRLKEAEKLYEEVFDKNKSLDNMLYLAKIKVKLKKYDDAEKYYKELERQLPQNRKIEAITGLIDVYQIQNKEEELIKLVNSISFSNINDSSMLYNIGLAFDKSGNREKAEEYYLKSIELNNVDISKLAMNNLAIMYYKEENLEKSLEYYQKLTDDFGMKQYAYNTGLIYSQLKKPLEAKKYLEIAYSLGDEKAIYHLAMAHYDLKEINEAKRLFQIAAKKGDKDAKLMLEGM